VSPHPHRDEPHSHGGEPRPGGDARLLLAAFAMLVAFLVGEVVAAVVAGSLALLADAGHLFTDALALLLAVAAARLARRPARAPWSFGLGRVEVLSAAVNAVALLVVAAVVLAEAVRRLVHPVAVGGRVVVVVAFVGLVVNVAVTLVLARADRHSMNVAGAFAHVVTDAYAFAATLVAGVVVVTTGFRRADPAASLVVVVLMVAAAVPLLRRAGVVLLERAPDQVDLVVLRDHLLGAPHVVDVHELHAWTVGSALPTVSAHVVVSDECWAGGGAPAVLDALQACLAGHFDVAHSTFQLEAAGHVDHELPTH
jgi:cobalt-zinc-cadmium efflux system protein